MLNLAATYQHRRHFSFSGVWTFATGDVLSNGLVNEIKESLEDYEEYSGFLLE